MKLKCIFCDNEKIKKDILIDYKDFFLKVGIGILAPGHVMLITKKHMGCFGNLSKQQMEEFEKVKTQIVELITDKFAAPIIYEHGIYGQTINHAHLHFLPRKNEFFDLSNIKNVLFNGLEPEKIESISQVIEIYSNEGSYFYLEIDGKKYVYHTSGQMKGKYNFSLNLIKLKTRCGLIRLKIFFQNNDFLLPLLHSLIT
jgi:diadenosine tetraphosphate (Ap4A) HIT family hydrolase